MGESDLQEEFNDWLKKLKPLPKDRFRRTVQIAKELADGVYRGYWKANIRLAGSAGNPNYQRKRSFWHDRLSTLEMSGVGTEAAIRAMEESLLSAGYVKESNSELRITPTAFALLRKPTRIERIDRWQTGIEIALVVIFLLHLLVLIPPAIESLRELDIIAQ